jgi:hypothetical protein
VGNCKYCGDKAGFLRSKHGMCEVNYREGLRDMRALASRAAASTGFNQATLYESLSAIAQRSWAGESDIQAAIVAGWNQAVSESLADGVLTHDEETRLREFRDGLALTREDTRASDARLEVAFRDRLMLDARLAALAVSGAETHLHELAKCYKGPGYPPATNAACWCWHGKRRWRARWKTGCSPWTRKRPWCGTSTTSTFRTGTWTQTALIGT